VESWCDEAEASGARDTARVGEEEALAQSGTEGERAMPVFRGVTELALDAKGRFAVPARYRDGLAAGSGPRLVLTADPSRCLLLYPLAAWEPIQARLMALSSFDERIRGLQRLLVGHADDVEIDAAGRILVPPALRRYASLDKRVVLVGQGRKFELWDDAAWAARTAQAIAFDGGGLPPELDGFSL
jgi:MraZ protein